MHNRPIISLLVAVLLLALFLGSCSDQLGLNNDADGNDRVRFAPTITEVNDLKPTDATRAMAENRVIKFNRPEGAPQLYLHIQPSLVMSSSKQQADGTRAIYITNNTIETLYYRIYRENDASSSPFVPIGTTTKANNWMTDTEWPHGSGQKFRVYSICPYVQENLATLGHVTNQFSYSTSPIFSYEMPDSANQEDLIYAVSDPCDPEVSHAITMNYRHVLSGISLSEGSMVSGIKLKTVEIKGLYYKGSCNLADPITWTVDETATTNYTLTKNYTSVGRNPTLITPTDRNEIMVIPQTAPDGATITVTLDIPNVGEKKLTTSIAGTKFQRGVDYWFLLSTRAVNWRYTLNVSQSELSTPYNGGTAAITVNSWRTSANNDGSTTTQEAEPYKIEYSEDNGTTWTNTKPDWLTGVPSYVSGLMSNETSVATGTQTAVTYFHTSNLQDKTAVTDYDLSRYDINGKEIIGGASTANCYVIRGPGSYRIPCVYGNTLKFGTYNGYAVDDQNESGEYEAFVNYNGDRISESNYMFKPASAAVLWQSTSGVITNAAVTTGSDGMSYITFTVNKANLQQGNAVIAAYNSSGTVMWSWHLWITDATLTAPNNDFLTQNLGWVSSSDSYNHYPARTVQLRITQTNELSDAEPVFITVNQTEGNVDIDPSAGSCLYYQWGRKDPFRASDITEDNCELIRTYQGAPLYHAIQNPSTPILYYYSNDRYDWASDHYNVLWNSRYATQQTNTPVEKSVYDPSPYGFRAPRGPKTYDLFSSLPNMGYYSLNRGSDWSWSSGYYYVTVTNNSSKYYWTSRANNSDDATSWYGYSVSAANNYNTQTYCSNLLPMRPYKDTESGSDLQKGN